MANSETTKRIAERVAKHIKPDTLLAIQMRADGTSWSEIADEIEGDNHDLGDPATEYRVRRAVEQRARRASQWLEKHFGDEWGGIR